MGAALAALGYSVFPEELWYGDSTLREDFLAGRYDRLPSMIERYEAFEDSPFNHSGFFKWLYASHPEAKFILTVREAARLLSSHKRWLDKLDKYYFAENEALKAYARDFFRIEFGQNGTSRIDDEAKLIEMYEARNSAVISFFAAKPDQLLVIDLEREDSPWTTLCGFLHAPVPRVPFPHLKRTR
jgi:hypothetical protein